MYGGSVGWKSARDVRVEPNVRADRERQAAKSHVGVETVVHVTPHNLSVIEESWK